jgi:hypothetical protein
MAGGQGQRFWPLSTADRPKQFLDLERSGRTLLQATYDRLLPLTGGPTASTSPPPPATSTWCASSSPTCPPSNLLIEPTGRDSAPAVALASLAIHDAPAAPPSASSAATTASATRTPSSAAVRDGGRLAEPSAASSPSASPPPTPPPPTATSSAATVGARLPRGALRREAERRPRPAVPRGRPLPVERRHLRVALRRHPGDELDAHAPDIMGRCAPPRPTAARRRLPDAPQDQHRLRPHGAHRPRLRGARRLRLGRHRRLGRARAAAGRDGDANTVVGTHVGSRPAATSSTPKGRTTSSSPSACTTSWSSSTATRCCWSPRTASPTSSGCSPTRGSPLPAEPVEACSRRSPTQRSSSWSTTVRATAPPRSPRPPAPPSSGKQVIENPGKAAALNAGFAYARRLRPRVVVCLDGDAQHEPAEVPHLAAPVLAGVADVVVGSRFLQTKSDIPAWRQVGQHTLTALTNNMSGLKLSDSQSGFRAFSPTAVDLLRFTSQGLSVESEMQFLFGPANLSGVGGADQRPLPGRQQAQPLRARPRGHRRHGQPGGAAAAAAVLLAAGRAAGDGGDGRRRAGHPDDERTGTLMVGSTLLTTLLLHRGPAAWASAGVILHSMGHLVGRLRVEVHEALERSNGAVPFDRAA